MEKEKNIRLFEGKYGDGNIAYRSIASQSAYNSSSKNEFRRREKSKEMHARGMRFTARISGFSNIGKESIVRKAKRKSIVQVDSKAE